MTELATQKPPGINTYSYIWTMPAYKCVESLRDQGYQEFELLLHPPHLSFDRATTDHRALRGMVRNDGIRIHSLNLPSLDTNLASVFPEMRAFSQGMFRQALELCADLEVPYLITVPGRVSPLFPPDRAISRDLVLRSIEALLPDAERLGVKLAIENVPFATLPEAKSVVDFVKSIASPHLAITYDVANAHFIGENPAEGLAEVSDYLAVVHFSDTTQTSWKHDPIGEGDVDFGAACAALDSLSWCGPVMLEIISDDAEKDIRTSHDALSRFGFPHIKGD